MFSYLVLMVVVCLPLRARAQNPAIAIRSSGEADVLAALPNQGYTVLDYLWATPGSQWNGAAITDFPPFGFETNPAIAIRSTGEADVVWRGVNNTLQYAYAFPGTKWTILTIDGPGTTFSDPAIAVLSNEADIVWQGANNTLQFATEYPYIPGAWSINTIAGPGSTFSNPAIAIRPTDNERNVVWQGANNTLLHAYAYTGFGGTWSKDAIDGENTAFSAPAIAIRSSGEVDVVWQSPSLTLGYAHSSASGWSLGTIDATALSPPKIVVRSTGETDIVWIGEGGALQYAYAFSITGPWNVRTIDTLNTNYDLFGPAIAVRSDGEADVVATEYSIEGSRLIYYWATPGSQWQKAVLLSTMGVIQ